MTECLVGRDVSRKLYQTMENVALLPTQPQPQPTNLVRDLTKRVSYLLRLHVANSENFEAALEQDEGKWGDY